MLSHNLLQWWMNPCLYQGTMESITVVPMARVCFFFVKIQVNTQILCLITVDWVFVHMFKMKYPC